jgi:hypothetical protein
MVPNFYGVIISLTLLSIFNLSYVSVFANELDLIEPAMTNNFTNNLKAKINNIISNALNDTDNVLNSSFLTNESNQTSSNVIISKNKVTSTINSNGSDGSSSSIIKDQVKTIDGICTSTKVGGSGNDTLASSGNCDDQLTGGLGADKFMCGEGNDIIMDYDPKEGDTILDRQNCEKIL